MGAFSPAASTPRRTPRGRVSASGQQGWQPYSGPRSGALDALLDRQATPATRTLGVTVLEAALLAIYGLDQAAVARGERVRYVKGAVDAVDAAGPSGTAFLLDPTPAAEVVRVAQAGELMPQKSTYFSPKPVTGLLFAPGEW